MRSVWILSLTNLRMDPQMIKNNIGGAGQGAGGGDSGPRGSTPTRGLDGGMGGGPGGVPGVNRNNNTGGSYNGPNGTGNKVLQRQDSAVTQKAGQDGAGGGGPNRDEIDRINAKKSRIDLKTKLTFEIDLNDLDELPC